MKLISSIKNKIWGFFYPKRCCFCGKVSEKEMCNICAEKVVYIAEPRCKKCGKPIRYEEQEYCYDCMHKISYYEQGKSLWLHKGIVKDSIYQFKYHNRRIYAEFYAKELYRMYEETIRNWKVDLIVPIPLHPKRRKRRGYNQAEIIARNLGKLMGIEVDAQAVERVRYTNPQKELDNKDRRKNLRDAFVVRKQWGKSRKILLVDDIYTTGSTINEVSRALCENCGNKVWFLTISIGQDF